LFGDIKSLEPVWHDESLENNKSILPLGRDEEEMYCYLMIIKLLLIFTLVPHFAWYATIACCHFSRGPAIAGTAKLLLTTFSSFYTYFSQLRISFAGFGNILQFPFTFQHFSHIFSSLYHVSPVCHSR